MSWSDRDITDLSTAQLATWLTVGVVLFVLLLAGPVGGVDLTGEPPSLGEGSASVTVVEPSTDHLTASEGRFGTNVTYVRIPDAILDVERVSGQPRVVYQVTVPNLSVDRQNWRYIESTGRLRVPISDRALARPSVAGTYDGRMLLRVQAFGYDEIILDRRIEVTIE